MYHKEIVFSWKVQNPNRLLNEIKNRALSDYSAKDLKWSVEHNRCFVNDSLENFSSAHVSKGDKITFYPEKRPLFQIEAGRIVYEDEHLLLYSKPPFLSSENLATLAGCRLVHRLDRDTSGLILLAKNEESENDLIDQFRRREIAKEYLAWISGDPGKEGVICEKMAPIHRREGAVLWGISSKGVPSKTIWRSLKRSKKRSLIQCIPITGRTHQIRVHFKHIGCPLIGDYTYGSSYKTENVFRPLLHACRLKFSHPRTNHPLNFTLPPPLDFKLN